MRSRKIITKKFFVVIGLVTILSSTIFVSVKGEAREKAIVRGYVEVNTKLNVRKEPSTSSEILKKLEPGDIVEIIGENDNFYNISVNVDGIEKEAYAAKDYIKIPEKDAELYELEAAAVISNNKSSDDRNYNMALACEKLNGLTLEPEEKFDWYGENGVGNASAENGFKRAPVIIEGVSVMGEGGGVCQVSTAMYNCILDLGIIPTEIYHHSITSSYVEKGKDATVAYNSKNFKFENTLDYTIEFETFTEGGRVIVLAFKKL